MRVDDELNLLSEEILFTVEKIEQKQIELIEKISDQEKQIKGLEKSKLSIEKKYETLRNKVKEYIQELEEIKEYVNSNNQPSK